MIDWIGVLIGVGAFALLLVFIALSDDWDLF